MTIMTTVNRYSFVVDNDDEGLLVLGTTIMIMIIICYDY